MRHILFYIIFINFVLMSCNEYKKVIKDFGLHSYYLAINVEYDNRVVPIVLENADFYSIIKDDSLTVKEYNIILENLLNKKKPYKINSKVLVNKFEEFKVNENLLRGYTEKSRKSLVTKFFNKEGVQQKRINSEEKKAVIYLLFKYNVFVKTDDETGLLYIP